MINEDNTPQRNVKTVYSDGGRKESGIKDRGACTVNGLANSSGLDYAVAHQIAALAGRRNNSGWWPNKIVKVAKRYDIKYRKLPIREITLQKFIKKNSTGRFYVATRRHAFAVVDGAVMDWLTNGDMCRLVEAYQLIENKYAGQPIKVKKLPKRKYRSR
jgi:hypothetical protein